MPDEPNTEAIALTAQICAFGPEAPPKAHKMELMRLLRATLPHSSGALDESLLRELDRLHVGLVRAQTQQDELKDMFDRLMAPPWHVGVYLGGGVVTGRGASAVVAVNSLRRVVNLDEGVELATLEVGDEVLLNTEQNLLVARSSYPFMPSGETAVFDRMAGERHLVIRSREEEIVVQATDRLLQSAPRPGDVVRWDRNLWLAFDKLQRTTGAHLFLDDTPSETFAAVGGLDAQIAELQRTIRLHYEHSDVVRKYGLRRRAAVLLAGPPGTGKTLVARALANWLAELSPAGRSRFMNVKPGSLHSMWYSQSEANYREAFRVARAEGERDPDVPVVMFFDEVDAIGGARGDSMARVDDRVLTAFLTELDGLESRGNVLVVCATNRRDALDPALLRPGGRLGDIILEVPRPNRQAAREIFARHLPASTPFAVRDDTDASSDLRNALIDAGVSRIYAPNGHGELATLTLRDGKRRPVLASELVSGAVIANIARRAIERACMREVETGAAGVELSDLLEAVDLEFESAARTITPANCRRFLEGLPQDVDVVRVERPTASTTRRAYRYLNIA